MTRGRAIAMDNLPSSLTLRHWTSKDGGYARVYVSGIPGAGEAKSWLAKWGLGVRAEVGKESGGLTPEAVLAAVASLNGGRAPTWEEAVAMAAPPPVSGRRWPSRGRRADWPTPPLAGNPWPAADSGGPWGVRMEAALFVLNLAAMLALVLWSGRADAPGREKGPPGLLDLRPGNECETRKRRRGPAAQIGR